MLVNSDGAVSAAERLVRRYGTRSPERLAEELGIVIMPRGFKRQKGVYKVIERSRYIFIKDDLHPVMRSIVLLHEIGHDQLHRGQAAAAGGFRELDIFDMTGRAMEYEANLFAAQISLPGEELMEYIMAGCDAEWIARVMGSDANLVAIRAEELRRQGCELRHQEPKNDFLRKDQK